MNIVKESFSIVFAPFIKGGGSFWKFITKRNTVKSVLLKLIVVLLIFYAVAWYIVLVGYILGTIIILNLGVLWFQAVLMIVQSILKTGGSSSWGKGKKKKKSPSRKPRGGKKSRRNRKRTARSSRS